LPLQAQIATQPSDDGKAPETDPDRKQALEFLENGKMVQAMPLFEKLCSEYPKDAGMWERWGTSTLSYAQTLGDPSLRKKARSRGRSFLLKARELGDNSNLVQTMLGMIPEDGGDLTYSPRKDVDDAMQQAEAEFARGNYEKAREGYLRVLLIDPKNYDAALFMGDVYFKQHINGSAGEWFARAIEIDPNRETAYRYWGDALWASGKRAESREKFILAVIAEPYNNNRAWNGLNQWAEYNKVSLHWVRLQDRGSVSAPGRSAHQHHARSRLLQEA
jgi:tetratricopeptide (TPR) repeat protein